MATNTSGIYRIHCLTDDRTYIGRSVHIERRWAEHRKSLTSGKHRNPLMQAAWDKYGEQSFLFEVVEVLERDKLQQREQEYLDELFECGRPFNLRKDACGGADHTPEQIEKMSRRRTEANHEMWKKRREEGWRVTEEVKKVLSEAARGKHQSEETKAKRAESVSLAIQQRGGQWNKGKTLSPEDKMKKSLALKAYWQKKKQQSSPQGVPDGAGN